MLGGSAIAMSRSRKVTSQTSTSRGPSRPESHGPMTAVASGRWNMSVHAHRPSCCRVTSGEGTGWGFSDGRLQEAVGDMVSSCWMTRTVVDQCPGRLGRSGSQPEAKCSTERARLGCALAQTSSKMIHCWYPWASLTWSNICAMWGAVTISVLAGSRPRPRASLAASRNSSLARP